MTIGLRSALFAVSLGFLASAVSADETVRMEGGYSPVFRVPVDDVKTKFVPAALFEPSGAGPFPAVIILGGCEGTGSEHDLGAVKRANADYLAKGIATLIVDSFSPRGIITVCGDRTASIAGWDYRAEDAYAAMDWLIGRSEIDARHIFAQGYSHGGRSVIEAVNPKRAAKHKQQFTGVIAFYPRCEANMKFSAPTIILAGERDDLNPPKLCEDIVDKTNVEVVTLPHAGHGFASPGFNPRFAKFHVGYDESATNEAQRRAIAFIESLNK